MCERWSNKRIRKKLNLRRQVKAVDRIDHAIVVVYEGIPLESHKRIRAFPNIERRSSWAEYPFHLSAYQT